MDFAKGPGAKFGRSNSLKWPWLYDKLVSKGYDHSKAAAISNSRIGMRKSGRLNVLTATQAHSVKVQRRIAADDKKHKHSTKKSLTSSAVEEFFNKNHSKTDGEFISGGSAGVEHKLTQGQQRILERGVARGGKRFPAQTAEVAGLVKRGLVEKDPGKNNGNTKLWNLTPAGRKAAGMNDPTRGADSPSVVRMKGSTNDLHVVSEDATHYRVTRREGDGMPFRVSKKDVQSGEHPIIKASEARGDSRAVSHEEFQTLAREGQAKLDKMATDKAPITGMNANWEKIKADSFAEVKKSWGGATIDSHTGHALPQGVEAYALTVKDQHTPTVSIHENATRAEFDAAMEHARTVFGPILERQQHNLGVFHDDKHHRIDIDPVIVVRKHRDVETIGAATRAIGGAYNFKDGNGYWPVHVGGS